MFIIMRKLLRKTDDDFDGDKHAHIAVIGYVYIVDDDCCLFSSTLWGNKVHKRLFRFQR